METNPMADRTAVYAAARRFADRVLPSGGSLYNAERVWTSRRLAGLDLAIRSGLDGLGSFTERWDRLLAEATPATRRLAAEVLHVHLLFPADVGAGLKRQLVAATLAPLPRRPRVPPQLWDSLEHGVATSGVAYKTRRLSQLAYLVGAARRLRSRPAGERDTTLRDPQAWRAWLATVPPDGGHAQREALSHLLFPQAFEPIVSRRVKQQIVAAFLQHAGDGDDADVSLSHIRAALSARYGDGFAFTDSQVAAQWRHDQPA